MSVESNPATVAEKEGDSVKGDQSIWPPSHRHAAPFAPWPWVDIEDDVNHEQLCISGPTVPAACDHSNDDLCNYCWKRYPQSLFPNWTPEQVKKSKIREAIDTKRKCVIYQIDVTERGSFKVPNDKDILCESNDNNSDETWRTILDSEVPDNNRVRILFIRDLSGPVLQMLGARYHIEPFFFSSSLNWIPSRYQENVQSGKGDHITICLTFLRSVPDDNLPNYLSDFQSGSPRNNSSEKAFIDSIQTMIDMQAPLHLKSRKRALVQDLLSVHLIRNKDGNTIISYHADNGHQTTSADYLHKRIRFAGQSVYWQNIFQRSSDPTFVLLILIWHTLYAWDEAFDQLYVHMCTLEAEAISSQKLELTRELHVIRAHLYYYSSLLNDVRKAVEFIEKTQNPAIQGTDVPSDNSDKEALVRECSNLLGEVDRLEMGRQMQDRRLKNVMNLVFSSVNIEDSRSMKQMTRMTARDSAAMKQIAYLTMFFLPASFIATVFGMNVKEISPDSSGTLVHYTITVFPFTFVTVWVIIAFQSKYFFPDGMSLWMRLGWPVFLFLRLCGKDIYPADKIDDSVV